MGPTVDFRCSLTFHVEHMGKLWFVQSIDCCILERKAFY